MSLATEQFLGMIRDIQDTRTVRRFEDLEAAANAMTQRALDAEDEVAGLFALCVAVEAALARAFPKSPLIVDKALRDRIYAAGVYACRLANSYGAAREAGRTFNLPSEVNQQIDELLEAAGSKTLESEASESATHLLLQTTLAEHTKDLEELDRLRQQLAQVEAQRDLFAHKLDVIARDCAHHMAQSAAFREQLRQVQPDHPLLQDAALRRRIADVAYEHLLATDPPDWNVVKEVGRTWVMPHQLRAEDFLQAEEVLGEPPSDVESASTGEGQPVLASLESLPSDEAHEIVHEDLVHADHHEVASDADVAALRPTGPTP